MQPVSISYLKDLDKNYEACSIATSDPRRAADFADNIVDKKLADKTRRFIAIGAPKEYYDDPQKTFFLLTIVEKITDQLEQAKAVKKILERTTSASVKEEIAKRKYSTETAQLRADGDAKADAVVLQDIQAHLSLGRIKEALSAWSGLTSAEGRKTALTHILSAIPLDFKMPKDDAHFAEKYQTDFEKLIKSVATLNELEPKQITRVLKDGRHLIISLAASGFAEKALEVAKVFQSVIRSDHIDNALDRAAVLTLLYDKEKASAMRQLITIPKRAAKCDAGMEQIRKAQRERVS